MVVKIKPVDRADCAVVCYHRGGGKELTLSCNLTHAEARRLLGQLRGRESSIRQTREHMSRFEGDESRESVFERADERVAKMTKLPFWHRERLRLRLPLRELTFRIRTRTRETFLTGSWDDSDD